MTDSFKALLPFPKFDPHEQRTWNEVSTLSVLTEEAGNVGTNGLLNMTLILYSDNILPFHYFLLALLMHLLLNKDNVAMCIKKERKKKDSL